MPSSAASQIDHVVNLVGQVPHARILDIGPGYGKYGLLLREYLNEKPELLVGAEAWPPYVERFPWLHAIYDEVVPTRAQLLTSEFLAGFDVVVMVDVIEHMTERDAEGFIARCPGRVVICTPSHFFHNGDGLPPTEEHVSHWPLDRVLQLGVDLARTVEVAYEANHGVLARLGPLT